MLRTIHLHGALRREFGGPFRLDVDTAAEALRGLIVQLAGFRRRLAQGDFRIVRGPMKKSSRGRDALDEKGCHLALGTAAELHVVPVVAGAGGRGAGVGKIIAGVALVGLSLAAPYLAPIALDGTAGALSIAGISASTIGMVGLALGLSGANVLLAKTPETPTPSDQRSSFLLGAASNFAAQGGCVPVGFGRFRYQPKLISAGLRAVQIADDQSLLLDVLLAQLHG